MKRWPIDVGHDVSEAPLIGRGCGLNVALALTALLTGCVTSIVEESRHTPSGNLAEDEAVVILTRATHTENETEDDFTQCLTDALSRDLPSLRLHTEDEFVDMLYPWFEPRLAPSSPEDIPKLLSHPMVAEAIERTNVRYVVWVNGSTETTDAGGSMTCAASVSGGGCFGLSWWEKDSSYEASVWDLHKGEAAVNISADATGTSYLAGVIVPVPIIARTQNAACKGLAQQLGEFLGPGD